MAKRIIGRTDKQCLNCEKTFRALRNQVFCTKYCSRVYKFQNSRVSNGLEHIAAGTVGRVSEIMVCVDLMKKGFEVYTALSTSSHCDLLAIKDKITYGFEVRTGQYFASKNGHRLHYPTNNIGGKTVVVVTHSDNKIHYMSDNPVFL
jgi:hypothetical protein